MATIQIRSLMRSRRSGRSLASRQPQIPIGSITVSAASPKICIDRSAMVEPAIPRRLRTGVVVAWLSEGSRTDQVASATASSKANRINARPTSWRSRRRSASRASSVRKVRLSRVRSIADMVSPSAQHADQPVQRFRGRGLVLHQRDPNIARARIAAVGLVARQIAARDHAQPRFAPQPQRDRLVAAMGGDVEPEQEAASRPAIGVAAAEYLIGEIELQRIEAAVLLDMSLI